ncbi:hypothetical protein [Nocardia sp. NPDC051832]|uniref:hypothetical protein n=1 Tax=Nocardia sp. NPDC051832 TaxID=3155673 RepID=UPI00341D995D
MTAVAEPTAQHVAAVECRCVRITFSADETRLTTAAQRMVTWGSRRWRGRANYLSYPPLARWALFPGPPVTAPDPMPADLIRAAVTGCVAGPPEALLPAAIMLSTGCPARMLARRTAGQMYGDLRWWACDEDDADLAASIAEALISTAGGSITRPAAP